jgi:hypothetical protein
MATTFAPRITYGRKLIACTVCGAPTRQYLVTGERVMAVCNNHLSGDRYGAPETRTTVSHPTSGETYAVEMHDGIIVRAAGPLPQGEAIDDRSLESWLTNNRESAEASGAWLQAEIDKAFGNA